MEKGFSYVRLLHAAPLAEPVNVYANDTLIAKNLKYREFTEYLKVKPETYNIRVVLARDNKTTVLDEKVSFIEGLIYTAAVIEKNELSLELITDTEREKYKDKAGLRFINLSPDSTMFDIYIDNKLVICGMIFKEVSGYLMLNPGTYSMTVKETSTGKNLLEDPKFTVKAGDYYAAYYVGLVTSKPPLQVLIPLEGTSYL